MSSQAIRPSSNHPPLPPSTTPGPSNATTFKHASFTDVLEDLSCRFIVNLPEDELRSIERVCFQVEQAHWYYEDFVRDANSKLPSLSLKKFSEHMFNYCQMLQPWSGDHEIAFNQFMAYKTRVPVCGAIMLNEAMDKVVLVKGWKSSAGWGFPKGKINQNEKESDCAVREVLEETGYNLAGQVIEDHRLTSIVREQSITLFIVSGVSEDFEFKTRTRKEIGKIEWFKLADLPGWKKRKETPGKFYLITPFMGQLKDFLTRLKKARKIQESHVQEKLVVDIHSTITFERSSGEESPAKESSSLSSSTGNGVPTTPPPDQAIFLNGSSTKLIQDMDPHLANLLNNLSLSALAQAKPSVSEATIVPSRSDDTSSSSNDSSPESSEPSPTQAKSQAQQNGATSVEGPTPSRKLAHRKSKHIALLDSVVEDLPTFTPPPAFTNHSGPMIPSEPQINNTHSHVGSLGRPGSAFQQGYYPPQVFSQPPHNTSNYATATNHIQHPGSSITSNVTFPDTPFPQQAIYSSYPQPPNPLGLNGVHPSATQQVPPPPPHLAAHQSQLLSLLSPRSRAISQPPMPPPHMAVPFHSFPTDGAISLSSGMHPSTSFGLPVTKPIITRPGSVNLLSILNGTKPGIGQAFPS